MTNSRQCPVRATLLAACLIAATCNPPLPADAAPALADSLDFTVDTRGPAVDLPGISSGDSLDFVLDTTGSSSGLGGVSRADSGDFPLNTLGLEVGVTGLSQADSADFVLDTRGGGAGLANLSEADSADFTLDTTTGPPVITVQPQSQVVQAGQNVSFSVVAEGEPTLSYQWLFNGGAYPGATDSTFIRAPARPADAGSYQVIITNIAGSVTSEVATLTVLPAPTKTWVGPLNGAWSDPANWSPAGVPGLHDTVIVTNGTVNLTAPVTIGGQFNWSGGTLTGNPLTIASGGALNLNGHGYLNLESALTNAGTVNWLGGIPRLDNVNAGPVVNQAGGQWNILCDSSYIDAYSRTAPNACFINAGTVRKTGGSPNGYTSIYLRLNNTGLVNVEQGTLYFENGGPIGGNFSAASGAVIAFDGGDFTGAGAALSGPGLFRFSGGTLLLTTDIIPNLALTGGTVSLRNDFQGGSITNLTVAGSTLSGTNTVTGTLNWNRGSLSGPLTVAGGTLNLNGSGYLNLESALTNNGTVNWLGGIPRLDNVNAGPVVNQAGGQWNILCDSSYMDASSRTAINACFVNAGTVRKTGGSPNGYSSIYLRLDNTGVVSVDQGTLYFDNGGPIGGSFNAASGAVVAFNGGDFVSAGAMLNGSGLCKFSGGTLLLTTDIIPNLALTGGTVSLRSDFQGGSIANLTLAGSTLSGANIVTGTLNWNGGALTGPLTVTTSGTLNINGTGYLYLQSALTNAGTVNWLGGIPWLHSATAGPVVNQATGQWNIRCDSAYMDASSRTAVNACFVNQGTVRKSGGSPNGSTSLYFPFSNGGTVSVLSGSVNLSGGYTQTGATLEFGLAGVGHPAPLQVSGALTLDGTLRASLANYTPHPGDTIPLVSYGTLANSFDYLDLPPAGNNLAWRIVYAPSPLSLQVVWNGAFTEQITGTVKETGGAPVAGVSVSAYTISANNSLFLSTVTSNSGTYALNVTNGTWRVGLQGLAARGYAELPGQDVVVSGANQVVDFVVQRLGSPALACELVAGRFLLHWPGTQTNWILEATPTLSANWVPVSQSPVPGGRWTVTLDPSDRASFFRLRKPQ